MAIISFEDIEEVKAAENPAVDQTEAMIDVAEKAEGELKAVDGLDEAIAKQDQVIADVEAKEAAGELTEGDVDAVKEEMVDNVVATESYLNTIFGAGNKKMASTFGFGLSFESINSDPIGSLKQHNAMLKSLRSKVTEEVISNIKAKQESALKVLNK